MKRTVNGSNKQTIVIIGDWFIDENWLITRQSLYHSSQTGDVHYQVRHKKIDKRIISLCGAAELLEVLRSYFEKHPGKNYKFMGYGAWNFGDNDVMQCTLCPDNTTKKLLTPYTLMSLSPINKTESNERCCPYTNNTCQYNPDLRNLAYPPSHNNQISQVSTNRIIRCYEGFGGGKPHLQYRFDWELPIKANTLNYERLKELQHTENLTAVIIEDHGKGVINEPCIKALLKYIPSNLMHSTPKQGDGSPCGSI